MLAEGITYLERTIDLDPRSAIGYANLALALRLQANRDDAVAAARNAIADAPRDEDIYTSAGTVFEWAGREQEAVKAYAAAITLDPSLTQAPFWSSTPERALLRGQVIAAAGLDACVLGRFAALYGVDGDNLSDLASGCRQIVDEKGSPSERAALALILDAMDLQSDARGQASLAMTAAPANKDVLLSTAVVLDDGLPEIRYDLLRARALGNRDALALLAATYVPGAGTANGITTLLPSESEEIPPSLARLLPYVGDADLVAGLEASSRTALYYSWGAMREAPAVTLIPGDWVSMTSPRNVLLKEISKRVAE